MKKPRKKPAHGTVHRYRKYACRCPKCKLAAADRAMLDRYGFGLDGYEERLKKQGGVCLICGKKPGKKRLHVDHCHETDVVRGLLCSNCNRGIGLLGDQYERLEAALAYLKPFALNRKPSGKA